ncbi:unnamed protein product [Prorocentrum cordatum]|uniref:Uncharacterized protein n=1 Tax=Prorocentrum cordatum TaxID=2364126 RepID=A0ABN9SKI3_9DINO|nr:unnamed protein product [Polarella glacialis]
MEDVAFQVAAAWAAALAAEALAPALDVARTVEAALETGGMATSLADYGALARALAPHFEAAPGLLEVQYSEALADGGGSILALRAAALSVAAARGARPNLSLRTDRGDCGDVPGGLGCLALLRESDPIVANGTGWFSRGFGAEAMHTTAPLGFWEGPSFTRVDLDEVVCTSLCWSPSVSFVAQPVGQPGLLRTVMDADSLRSVRTACGRGSAAGTRCCATPPGRSWPRRTWRSCCSSGRRGRCGPRRCGSSRGTAGLPRWTRTSSPT